MRLTLNSVFTNWKEDGIFKYLDNLNVPWKGVIDYKLLDLDFHSQHGQKIISTTVYNSITTNTGLTPQERQNLADLCFLKYNHKWEGWWNSLELESSFKPLANTDWKETVTTETSRDVEGQNRLGARTQTFVKGSQTDNQTIGDQTTTESARTNKVGAQTNTQENKVSAFNSSTYQPDKTTTDNTGERTDTLGGGSVSNSSRSDSQTEGERTDTNNQAAATDESHSSEYAKTTITTEKSGNIGVTTSGQLLEDYRTAVDFEFFEKVYTDLCLTLVIEVFESCGDDLEDYVIKQDYVLPTATQSRLGGIKVGRNLSVEADGTLNAQAEAGDVQSVNGKTGVVVLTNEDVNAPSLEAFNNLAASKQDKIVTEGFENGTFYGIWNGQANFREVFQVPAYDGQKGQVLTKGDGVRYEWKDSAGGGKIYLPASKVVRWKGYVYGGSIGTVTATNEYSFAIDLTDFIEDGYVFYLQYSPITSKVFKDRNSIRLGSNTVYLPPGDDTTEWSKSIDWYENSRNWSTYNNLYTYVLSKYSKGFYFQTGCSEPVEPGVDFLLSVWKEPSMF